jgi:DNA-binding GntR family transcriptional regulator
VETLASGEPDERVAGTGASGRARPRSRRFDSTEVQYARLRKEILDGVFAPGTILLETALSVKYGVSRTPVREALGRLAQDGLIERSTRGFRIKQRNPEQILEIYEARIALEARSAELAAKHRTDFDLARMAHLLDERQATTDPEHWSAHDRERSTVKGGHGEGRHRAAP